MKIVRERFAPYGGFAICVEMINEVLHQNSDPDDYEGMNWDQAADAVKQHLQIDGGKSTN